MKNVKYLCTFILIIVLTLIPFNAMAVNQPNLPKYNLSNYDYRGIVIGLNGNIYLGNHSEDEIDVFDKTGNRLFVLPCNIHGDFKFDINTNGNILIGDIRGEELLTYNEKGEFLDCKDDNGDAYYEIDNKNDDYKYTDGNGETFKIVSFFGNTKVVKTSKDGFETTILAIPEQWYAMDFVKNILIALILIAATFFNIIRTIKKFKGLNKQKSLH